MNCLQLGDPLSMLMYAAALTPLIDSLKDMNNWSQCWYADDSACAAKLPKLREWFDDLCKLGPAYGYYPEPQKTVVVVDAVDEAEANACFCDLGVKVVRGQRYLGGFIVYIKQTVLLSLSTCVSLADSFLFL